MAARRRSAAQYDHFAVQGVPRAEAVKASLFSEAPAPSFLRASSGPAGGAGAMGAEACRSANPWHHPVARRAGSPQWSRPTGRAARKRPRGERGTCLTIGCS
jgi:hypothetical protein